MRAARAAGVFSDPSMQPVHRRHRLLWDADQTRAHAAGQPVPPLLAEGAGRHPDDWLDAWEAAAIWRIDPSTWHDYRRTAPHRIPAPAGEVGGLWWRRGDVETFDRPGWGGGGSRRGKGVQEHGPRQMDRRAIILQLLADRPRTAPTRPASTAATISASRLTPLPTNAIRRRATSTSPTCAKRICTPSASATPSTDTKLTSAMRAAADLGR